MRNANPNSTHSRIDDPQTPIGRVTPCAPVLRQQSGALGTARTTKGGQTTVRVRAIDWEQPTNNDFLLVSQFSVTGVPWE
jgi:hypothetical protein